MNRGLSIYLDLLRLLAALEVLVYHLSGSMVFGIERSFWNSYGHEAVTIFFVLSGFVIRHAAGTRDTGLAQFTTSRLTRVYSVAIPCLILTLIFDQIGQAFAPDLYDGLITDGSPWLRLAIGSVMMNEAWVSVQMLSNTPYWSISYEFWYYFLFAALFYLKGRARWLMAAVVAVIAGPKILILFPIWAMGWAVYCIAGVERLPRWLGWLLFIQPLVVLGLYEHFHLMRMGAQWLAPVLGQELWRDGLAWSRFVLTDMVLGLSVAMHLIGARVVHAPLATALAWIERPIRYCAGQSFTLYLLHQPAMLMVGALVVGLPLGAMRGWVVGLGTIAVILLVATITEGQRHRLKPVIKAVVNGIASILQSVAKRPLLGHAG